jgi:predicted nucleotidyltransferase
MAMSPEVNDDINLAFLRQLPLGERAAFLPPFLRQVIAEAERLVGPSHMILFGSRARGDGVFGSDYDVAFRGLTNKHNWSRFVLDMEANAKTLHPFDLVIYDEASASLQTSIDQEGIVFYESKPS